jgi:xylulokinase
VSAAQTQFCLAVDLGTGGPKVGLVSLAGTIAWKDHVAVQTRRLDGGGAVQDAAEWWTLVGDAARRAMASGVIRTEQLVAVSVTGQWASTVPVDGSGRPVGECVLWQDTRGGRYASKVIGGPLMGYAPKAAVQWIRRTGGAPSATGADPIGHILLIEHEQPDVARAARWYLEPVDYLSMRFTGVAAASHASMTGAWLTDNRRLDVLTYDPVLIKLAGIDAGKLPPLRPTGSVIGEVAADVAQDLGFPPGVNVVTGTPDLHSAACGAGAVQDFETHLAISTSAWIGAPVPFKKTDVLHQIASVPGLSSDRYMIANNHETGGLCLEWLRNQFFPEAEFGALTELAAKSSPGAGDVLFTPWLNGERSPVDDRRARGGFHNLSLATGGSDLVRAVLEGVAYNSRWLHDAVEGFAKRKLDSIRMIGGGAQSDLWCQVHADVMDRTIERVAEPLHANLRGAAIFAGLALDAIRPDEVRRLTTVDGRFTPDPANRATYERLYAEFPKLYSSQKRMFARLNGGRRA